MTKDDTLKLALEALLDVVDAVYVRSEQEVLVINNAWKAITAIKEALELTSTQCEKQTEQEPDYCGPSSTIHGLAEMIMSDCGHSSNNQSLLNRIAERIQRHIDAATQQQRPWVGLTDEEIMNDDNFIHENIYSCIRIIEAKLKEKNGV